MPKLGLMNLICTEIFCVEKEGIEVESKTKGGHRGGKEDKRRVHSK